MAIGLDELGLAVNISSALISSRSYRPPSWPPPRDWVCIEDINGKAVSRWGDSIWDLSPWVGKIRKLNFGDGQKINCHSPIIDPLNADILRVLMTWKFWGPRGTKSINSNISNFFDEFRKIIQVCSDNGIAASELARYPAMVDKIANVISPSKFNYVVSEFDRILDAKDFLLFTLLDKNGIRRLKASQPSRVVEQTEYIPTRIWTYQVTRLKKCLDDYIAHQSQIEACFNFCFDAYKMNYGELMQGRKCHKNPFLSANGKVNGKRSGLHYHGSFVQTAERFGIKDLLVKWVGDSILESKGIQALSSYMSLITAAGMAYVMNFTLMRKEECSTIKADCLTWYEDEKFGKIPLIRGVTTKTESDDGALWIASPSVESAIIAMRSVALLRVKCIRDVAKEIKANPYLLGWTAEPWSTMSAKSQKNHERNLRPTLDSYCHILSRFPYLFDVEKMRINEDDMKIASSVTPTINKNNFKVGAVWGLAWHQLRRTGAVNMFASGKISDSSIQFQMKHLYRMMSLYYGNGNSNLRFSDELRVLLVNAQYEEMGRQLASIKSNQFVSPYGDEYKYKFFSSINEDDSVNLISETDAARYEKAARNHQISFRLTVLGACMKNGQCERDGIEAISDCAGGVDKTACAHALFDREKFKSNKVRLDAINRQLDLTPIGTPRYKAYEQEKRGLENYFVYINKNY